MASRMKALTMLKEFGRAALPLLEALPASRDPAFADIIAELKEELATR